MKLKDSFMNFAAKLGLGARNLSSQSFYGFDFITRNRTQLEAMYRTSWLVGISVDAFAEDMTQGGILIQSALGPDEEAELQAALRDHQVWQSLCSAIKWSRLFGGSLAVMLIDGQDLKTPLNIDSVGEDSFKGLLVLDRWMVNPTYTDPITELGPDLGKPKYYDIIGDTTALPNARIHHSRIIRFEGPELPYYQRKAENGWGQSIVERLHDRLLAFDSTTTGVAQLVFRAHLRTYKVENLRELIAAGGDVLTGLLGQIEFMRAMQSNEGITLLDSKDTFETHSYTFAGLSDCLIQFGQQLSGALQMPLVRLFGQSPAGLNSTGESDLRTYYDGIHKIQERDLRRPLNPLLDVLCRSKLGKPAPKGFTFEFNSLWQMTDEQKATVANQTTQSVTGAYEAGLVTQKKALQELRDTSARTGLWTNITDEDINNADETLGLPGPEGEEPMGEEREPGSEVQPGVEGGSEATGEDRPRLSLFK